MFYFFYAGSLLASCSNDQVSFNLSISLSEVQNSLHFRCKAWIKLAWAFFFHLAYIPRIFPYSIEAHNFDKDGKYFLQNIRKFPSKIFN